MFLPADSTCLRTPPGADTIQHTMRFSIRTCVRFPLTTFPMTLLFAVAVGTVHAHAQLPAGPDAALVQRTCTRCHEIDRVMSQRQDHDGWQTTVTKMKTLGLQLDSADAVRIVAYLAKNFPADIGPKLNINQASAVELEAAFSLKRSVASEVVKYRQQVGGFKSIDDLKKVPGINAAKVDQKKPGLTI